MIATSHVIISGAAGVAAAKLTHDPVTGAGVALIVGMLVHLVCDAIPHLDGPRNPQFIDGQYDRIVWTPGIYLFAITDSLIAFFLTLFIWIKFYHFAFLSPFAWGALGGYLPDFIDVFPVWREEVRKWPILKQFHRIHLGMHNWHFKYPMNRYWLLGIGTQVVTTLPCLYFLIK